MNIVSFTELRPVISVMNLFFGMGCFSILCVPSQLKRYCSFPKLGSPVYSFTPDTDKQMYVCMVFINMCSFLIFVFNTQLSQVFLNLRSVDVFLLNLTKL